MSVSKQPIQRAKIKSNLHFGKESFCCFEAGKGQMKMRRKLEKQQQELL